MTTYNTGNPIGSTDARDLYDNAQALDQAVNGSGTFTDRRGVVRPTLKSATDPSGLVQTAVNAKVAAEAARDAAVVNSTMYPDEATGRAAVADGAYFKVIGSGDVACREYRRTNAATSVLVASYPASGRVLDMRLGNLAQNLAALATLVGYIGTNGAVASTADNNWLRSDFIPFAPGDTLDCDLIGHTAINCVSFYNASKVFLSGLQAASVGGPFTQNVTAPANTAYIKLSFGNPATYPDAAGKTPYALKTKNVVNDLVSAESSIKTLQQENSVSSYAQEYASYATTAGWIGNSGQDVGTDTNWLRSGYLSTAPGEVVVAKMVGHTVINCVSFYDANKVFLTGYAASSSALPGAIFDQSVTAPANAAYFRISFGNPATYNTAQQAGVTPTAKITRNLGDMTAQNRALAAAATEGLKFRQRLEFTAMRKLVLSAASKVILYGDSISSTDYTWYKDAMQALTGAQVYNGGYSGQNAAMTAADAKLQRIWDYQPNLIVVLLGGNDSGASQTVGSFSGFVEGEPIVAETNISADYSGSYFIQAVSHTMRKIKGYYYNIRARANLTGTETEAEKTAKIDAVLKPVIVFCSSLPQKRNNSGDAFSQEANWRRKRDAIAECCAKYGVHYVDLQSKLSWDMTLEPYWPGATNMTTNFGVYTMDGLHPNKYGYQQMAEIVCAELGI